MSLRRGYGDHRNRDNVDEVYFSDVEYNEDPATKIHRQQIRKRLEERLEQKRLKEELDDDFEDQFDWDH